MKSICHLHGFGKFALTFHVLYAIMFLLLMLNVATLTSCSKDPNFVLGKSTFVHLFEWKWSEVAIECEVFLGPYGYGGVQISPPNENGIIFSPSFKPVIKRPWYERYQPVSYKLETRSGNLSEFKDMVRRCNKAGVRIYADIVVNHMTADIGEGRGTGGSYFNPTRLNYTGVPYGPDDFHTKEECGTSSGSIDNYQEADQVRNCQLSGLNDLDQSQSYVREKIVAYLNMLVEFGVAGFRFDAAKHMWPRDLQYIIGKIDNLSSTFFETDTRPFVFLEVIDLGGEAVSSSQYTNLGRVTEFRYGNNLGTIFRQKNSHTLKDLKNFGESWGMVASGDAVVFVDNHDNQRGHGAGGFDTILTFFELRLYKMATAFTLANPYGLTRIMSSYDWPRMVVNGTDQNDWVGPPHDTNYNIKSVLRNPDLTCGNGWICEHRWRETFNMAKFRNVVGNSPLQNWWDNGGNQIAFGRGDKGFIAINNDVVDMNVRLPTGLAKGCYCDVISGSKEETRCSGRQINVDSSGFTQILIKKGSEDPMIAFHLDSKI